MPEFAHPAGLTSRVSNNQRIIRNIFGNNSTGTNKSKPTDGNAANNGGIGSNSGSFLHQCWLVFVFSRNGASGINYIGKYSRWSQKHIVFTDHSGVNRHIILDFYAVANPDFRRNNHILAYRTLLPNGATRHDV